MGMIDRGSKYDTGNYCYLPYTICLYLNYSFYHNKTSPYEICDLILVYKI